MIAIGLHLLTPQFTHHLDNGVNLDRAMHSKYMGEGGGSEGGKPVTYDNGPLALILTIFQPRMTESWGLVNCG